MRYDVTGYKFSRQKAVIGFLEAIRARHFEMLAELRDVPVHEMEGTHLLNAAEFARLSALLPRRGVAHLHLVSDNFGDLQPLAPDQEGPQSPLPNRLVIIDEAFGPLTNPVLACFVPSPILAWATKCRVGGAAIETAVVQLRHMWRRRPEAAKDCSIVLSIASTHWTVPSIPIPSEKEWERLGVPPVGAVPALQSEKAFLKQMRAHYAARVRALYERGRDADGKPFFLPAKKTREIARHANWLVRVQIDQTSASTVARQDNASRVAVDRAVHRLAQFIELPLRRIRKSRHPTVRKERALRRRDSKK